MSLEYELEPYVNALKGRKAPVSAMEMNALINTVSRIANRYIDEAVGGGKAGPAGDGGEQHVLSPVVLDECLQHIDRSKEKIGETAESILESAEELLKRAGKDDTAKSLCFQIIEACDYHDIVGQRLGEIRRRLVEGDAPTGETAGVLAGPALKNDVDQDEIDRLFNS